MTIIATCSQLSPNAASAWVFFWMGITVDVVFCADGAGAYGVGVSWAGGLVGGGVAVCTSVPIVIV